MTAHSKILTGQLRKAANKKDSPKHRTAGRDYTQANRWVQCWGEGLPRFDIGPAVRRTDKGLEAVLVARCASADIELTFSATTPYSEIRAQVDDKILEILRHDAEDADTIDWDEWEAEGFVYDFDGWMTVMEGAATNEQN